MKARMKRKTSLLILLLAAAMLVAGDFSQGSGAPSTAKAVAAEAGRLQVHVLDVGLGQSVLVISPTGKAALIDGGGPEMGARVVAELRRRGLQKLELVVATQAGANYIGGLRRVIGSSDIVINNLIESGQPWKTDSQQQLLAAAESAHIPLTLARRGQFFQMGGGARLDILNPPGDGTWLNPSGAESLSRENANAVVVRLIFREFAMLIMGGAGASTAEQLLGAGQNIWAPVLLVGNGGAQNSASEKMLSIVQPRFAIISTAVGAPPAQETLERLRQAKAEIYRTDLQGQITITSDGKKHEVTSERKGAQ